VAVTSHDVIIMTVNQEPSAFYYCSPYLCKRLVNVYKFRVHVYKIIC